MIVHALTSLYKLDSLEGMHQPSDVYRMALYTGDAQLDSETEAYTTQGEVVAPGYQPGGMVLQGRKTGRNNGVAFLTWSNPTWPMATITARGALIYNYTRGNRAVAVLDFGKNISSTNGPFIVSLPEPVISM